MRLRAYCPDCDKGREKPPGFTGNASVITALRLEILDDALALRDCPGGFLRIGDRRLLIAFHIVATKLTKDNGPTFTARADEQRSNPKERFSPGSVQNLVSCHQSGRQHLETPAT